MRHAVRAGGGRCGGRVHPVGSARARSMDRYASQVLGVSSLILMENAAFSIRTEALAILTGKKPVCIFCGKGNNGGDGLAAARQLLAAGKKVSVFLAAPPGETRGEAAVNLEILRRIGGCRVFNAHEGKMRDIIEQARCCGLVIDALLGTGINGPVKENYAALIGVINTAGVPALSVDIPSGLNADTGRIMGDCVKAAVTVTFPAPKRGMFLKDGPAVCGTVVVRDLGVPTASLMKGRTS